MPHTLVLLRHGESEWNAKNLFTGWVDVGLTDKGRAEAVRGGEQLRDAGLDPDVVHTSLQRRAISTACLALDAADRHWIPVRRSWRLNETGVSEHRLVETYDASGALTGTWPVDLANRNDPYDVEP